MRLCSALCLSLLASPASANPLETELAGMANSCWERSYDAAHLKAHTLQQVTTIKLSAEVQEDGTIRAELGVNLRRCTGEGGPYDYAASSYCEAREDFLACPSEWEAGSFLIEKAKGGLKVYNKGMIINPSNYDSEDIAPGALDIYESDDKEWLLRESADESCDIY